MSSGRKSAEDSLQKRAAVYKSWANTADRAARTAPARAALLSRFEREVDPSGQMNPAERAQRAEAAKRAYFLELSRKSLIARNRRRNGARG